MLKLKELVSTSQKLGSRCPATRKPKELYGGNQDNKIDIEFCHICHEVMNISEVIQCPCGHYGEDYAFKLAKQKVKEYFGNE